MKIEEGKFYRTRDGQKVGPMRRLKGDHPWVGASDGFASIYYRGEDGCFGMPTQHAHDIIGEWQDDSLSNIEAEMQAEIEAEKQGPVRTVTRKELVFGVFGHVLVNESGSLPGFLESVEVAKLRNAPEIREAIRTLSDIADALESPIP